MAKSSGLNTTLKVKGESEYIKALSEVNSSLKLLGSEMKEVSTQYDKNDRSTQNLANQNEVLTKKIVEQEKKVALLREIMEKAAKETGENSETTKKYQTQLNNAQAQLNTMNRQLEANKKDMNAAESATDAEKKAVKEMGDEADKSSGKLQALGTALKATVTAAAAVGTAAVAVGKKLYDAANDTAEYGDEVDKMSQKLGMSSEAYQEWDYVLGMSGVDIESMTTGMKTLTNQIDDAKNGSEKAQERFKKLGISLEDLSSMSREDIFAAVVTGMQGMEDSTERAALANDLFGKSGQNLTPLFNETAESTQALKDAAHDLGMVMSDEAVKASAAYNDSVDTLNRSFTGFKNNLMGEVLPGMTAVVDGITLLINGSEEGGEKIKEGVDDVIGTVTSLIPKAVELLSTIAAAIIENAPAIIESLATAVIDLLPGAIELCLNDILPKLVNVVINIAKNLLKSLVVALPDIMVSLANAVVSIVESLFSADNIKETIQIILDAIEKIVEGLSEALPILIEGLFTLVSGIIEALPEIVEMISAEIPNIIDLLVQTIVTCLPVLIDGVISLIDGLIVALPEVIQALIDAMPGVISSIVSAIVTCLPALIEGALQLILGLVQALPELITSIVEALPTLISTIVDAVITNLPILIQGAIDLILGLVQALPDIILALIEAIPDIISAVVDALITCLPQLIEGAITLTIEFVKALPKIIMSLIEAIPKLMGSVLEAIWSGLSGIWEIGKNLVTGLWEGISNAASWLWEKVSGWLGDLWDGILNFFGIHSPSTKFRDMVGKNLVRGLAEGIADETDTAVKATEDLAKEIADVNFETAALDLSSIDKQLKTALPNLEAEAMINASVSDAALIAAGSNAATSNPVQVNITFGDVQMASDMDIENVAKQISDIIAAEVVTVGGAFK